MAMTVSVSLSNSDTKTNVSKSFSPTQTNARKSEQTKSIPTTAAGTALPLGDVATAGECYFENMEASGSSSLFIEIGVQSGGTFYPSAKLLPGEGCSFRFSGTPYARSDTAAGKLFFSIQDV